MKLKGFLSTITTIMLSTAFCLGIAQNAFASKTLRGEPPSFSLNGSNNPNAGPYDTSRLDYAYTNLWGQLGHNWTLDVPSSDYRNVVGVFMDQQFDQNQARLIYFATLQVMDVIHDSRAWGEVTDCAARSSRNYLPTTSIEPVAGLKNVRVRNSHVFMNRMREIIALKTVGAGSVGARRTHKYISFYLVVKKLRGSVQNDGSYKSGRAPIGWTYLTAAQSLEGKQRNYPSYVGLIGLNDHMLRADGAYPNAYTRSQVTVETIFHELLHNFSSNHSNNYADGEFMTEAEKCFMRTVNSRSKG